MRPLIFWTNLIPRNAFFLTELHTDEASAFLEFNFAPPTLRRNIGILGLLHKRVLGKSHPVFEKILPFFVQIFGELRPGEHNKQLYNHFLETQYQPQLFRRSIFGMVHIYNSLPQNVVDCPCVSSFQTALTMIARQRCEDLHPRWQHTFSCR